MNKPNAKARSAQNPLRLAAILVGAVLFLVVGITLVYADSTNVAGYRADESVSVPVGSAGGRVDLRSSDAITYYLFFPVVFKATRCDPIPNESYGTVAIISAPTSPPAEIHPDLNLAMRGYVGTTGTLGLVTYDNPVDPGAPRLYTLFGDNRIPTFSAVYQVYDWDWVNNRRGAPLTNPPVTLAGMVVTPGEIIRVPVSGYDIGRRLSGYSVMVLYASDSRLTLKYTREDNVIWGYTIHLENICVDPNLLALYQAMNVAGRTYLPALYAGQGVGRAATTEIRVAIRDTGTFMDPRSRTDWWQGR